MATDISFIRRMVATCVVAAASIVASCAVAAAEQGSARSSAARRDNPEFLRHLRESVPQGRSDRECVALNLIRHLEQGIESADYPPETLAHLEEFRAEFASRPFQALCELGNEKVSRGDQPENEAYP